MRAASVEELRGELLSRDDLLMGGWSDRRIAAAVAAGGLRRVRRGRFVRAEIWTRLWAESRHLLNVLAVAKDARRGCPVFSHESAAVLWGLPLYRLEPSRVHVLSAGADRSSSPDVLRHEGPVPDDDVVLRHGLRCTSLLRTVFDVTRTLTPEAALACADAALRRAAADGHSYDERTHAACVDELSGRLAAAKGARGIRQARWIVSFADGRAQLPLESVSRLQLVRLGFARPRAQVPVAAPRGGTYWVDLGMDDVHAFGECDGEGKYLDPSMRHGRSADEVLLEEKRREDWIRGTTQRRLARWGHPHVVSARALGARLASFGIHPPS